MPDNGVILRFRPVVTQLLCPVEVTFCFHLFLNQYFYTLYEYLSHLLNEHHLPTTYKSKSSNAHSTHSELFQPATLSLTCIDSNCFPTYWLSFLLFSESELYSPAILYSRFLSNTSQDTDQTTNSYVFQFKKANPSGIYESKISMFGSLNFIVSLTNFESIIQLFFLIKWFIF